MGCEIFTEIQVFNKKREVLEEKSFLKISSLEQLFQCRPQAVGSHGMVLELIYANLCPKLEKPGWIFFFWVIGRKFHFFHSFEPFFLFFLHFSFHEEWLRKNNGSWGKEIWIRRNSSPGIPGNLFPSFQFHPFIHDRTFRSPKILVFLLFQRITKLGAPLKCSSTNEILWKCRVGKIHAWDPVWVWIWPLTPSQECEGRNPRNIFQPGLFHDWTKPACMMLKILVTNISWNSVDIPWFPLCQLLTQPKFHVYK